MDAVTKQDPFVSITRLCQPTASQDFNSDQFSSSPDPTPSQPTGIVMVSPPGSITSKDAVFHTPPEHHLPAYFSSEDQNLDEVSSDRSKTARVSEFGGETVPADETEAIVDAFEGSEEGVPEAEVIVLDSTESGGEMANSNSAGDSADVVSVPEVNGIDGNHRLGEKCGSMVDIQVNKGKRPFENSCFCTSLGSVKSKEDSVELKCTQVNNGVLKTDGKRIDFRHVGTGRAAGGVSERRESEGKGKNGVETVKSKSGLLDFLDVLKVVFGEDMNGGCEEVDFLGTAKEVGLTFPRPRWWSTVGDNE